MGDTSIPWGDPSSVKQILKRACNVDLESYRNENYTAKLNFKIDDILYTIDFESHHIYDACNTMYVRCGTPTQPSRTSTHCVACKKLIVL